MDRLFNNMDFLVKHWAPFPRRYPSPFPLITANREPQKKEWMRGKFDTCNFSLILRGRGEFRRAGQTWPIQAPCVLTQWPKEYVEYGPPLGETWDELYLIYDARLMSKFKQCRLIDPQRPVWPIGDIAAVNAQIEEMEILTNSTAPEGVVDRMDRICERLILETLLARPHEEEGDQGIRRLIAEVQRHPEKPVDFEELAMRHGMSASTFRRRWATATGKLPPARFLQQLRLRAACRLLAETTRPINEIAHAVGFEDELYFSRRFRTEMQMAPRDYRNAYHVRQSGVKGVRG